LREGDISKVIVFFVGTIQFVPWKWIRKSGVPYNNKISYGLLSLIVVGLQ
jgi:hypothetical protein